jgi:hypothetical protein
MGGLFMLSGLPSLRISASTAGVKNESSGVDPAAVIPGIFETEVLPARRRNIFRS